ncbi:MAG: hypothetical protein LBC85_10460 [Fibromonadaceae bacterium]|nr:hypothetical protein [Fibromonadaceae bacterium]
MTDEEADALDEYYTKNPPRVDPSKNGGFARKSFKLVAIDNLCADYLITKAGRANGTLIEVFEEE